MKCEFNHEGQQYSAEEVQAALKFVKENFSLQAYAEAAHVDMSIDEIREDPIFWLGTKLQDMSKAQAEWWINDLAEKVAEYKLESDPTKAILIVSERKMELKHASLNATQPYGGTTGWTEEMARTYLTKLATGSGAKEIEERDAR